MRRITVELTAADITNAFGKSHRFHDQIRSLEVLTFLKSTPNEIVEICRVQLNDPATSIAEVFAHSSEEVSVLNQEALDTYVCFYRRRPIRRLLSIVSSVPGGYLSTPYEVRDGRLRITLLGNARSMKIFLKTLQEVKLHPRIVSLTDAVFSLNSPLEHLTEKQKAVIIDAFKNGYYDFPRKIGSEALAKKLGIREPTLVIHRRKAERKLFAHMLGIP
jgi:DNA binding protein with HTH domain